MPLALGSVPLMCPGRHVQNHCFKLNLILLFSVKSVGSEERILGRCCGFTSFSPMNL